MVLVPFSQHPSGKKNKILSGRITADDKLKGLLIASINLRFLLGYGPTCGLVSITEIRNKIINLANLNSNQMKLRLKEAGIYEEDYDHYIALKEKLKRIFFSFILDSVKFRSLIIDQYMPDISNDDIDLYYDYLAETMESEAENQAYPERFYMELIRACYPYPDQQIALLKSLPTLVQSHPILRKVKTSPLDDRPEIIKILPDVVGQTKFIDISMLVSVLRKEGVLPKHIISMTSFAAPGQFCSASTKLQQEQFENALQLFTIKITQQMYPVNQFSFYKSVSTAANLSGSNSAGSQTVFSGSLNHSVLNEDNDISKAYSSLTHCDGLTNNIIEEGFKDFSTALSYENIGEKNRAFERAITLLNQARTLADYSRLFSSAPHYVNRHKWPLWDALMSNENTAIWQNLMTEIRAEAFKVLLTEVRLLKPIQKQIDRLDEACDMPLFKLHTCNHWVTGAFGHTPEVAAMKKLIEALNNQLREQFDNRPGP